MEKKIGIFEAKTKLSELCQNVAETDTEYIVTRRGKPIARIVGAQRDGAQSSLSQLPINEALEQWEAQFPAQGASDFPDVWEERRRQKSSPFEADFPDSKR